MSLILNQQFAQTTQSTGYQPPSVTSSGSSVVVAQAVFADFAKRLQNVEKTMQASNVGSDNVLSTIALSAEAILIQSSKIGIAGDVTFATWYRDVNGKSTGVLDPSITMIRGGVIQTGKVMSYDTLSYLNLDASGTVPFLVCGTGVAIEANGNFTLGSGANSIAWNGSTMSVSGSFTIYQTHTSAQI